jgi:N6-L-threonylcarbamoyladenine synthase
MLGLPYPGGPLIDEYAQQGNPIRFHFPEPQIDDLNFSFSGVKTAVLYFLQKQKKEDPEFVEKNIHDICASIQHTIINILLNKLKKASIKTGISNICIAGGVAANKGLRNALQEYGKKYHRNIHIPSMQYCTDNAAMIAIAGKFLYEKGIFADQTVSALARLPFQRQ